MSVGDWVITLIITSLPLVGFIMLFVWGFGSGTNENKANYAKAALIIMVIGFILTGIFFTMFSAAIFSSMNEYNG